MATALTHEYRVRKNFGKIKKIIDIPALSRCRKRATISFSRRVFHPRPASIKDYRRSSRAFSPFKISAAPHRWSLFNIALGTSKYDVDECLAAG